MKSRDHFHFKQFSIAHDRCTHKIGTDGVLLGAWVNVEDAFKILDIGTGSGVIALMLAQRTNDLALIEAVEIEEQDAAQANENVLHSPWPQKILIHHSSIQAFSTAEKKFDLIVSNPPYFINSWQSPEQRRSQARHTGILSFEDLLKSSVPMLKDNGRLSLILPYNEGLIFTALAEAYDLFPIRKLEFRSRMHKPVERLLFEFSRQRYLFQTETLILHGTNNGWSDDYRKLTADFYLKS